MFIGLKGTVTAITKAGEILKAGQATQGLRYMISGSEACAFAKDVAFVTDECLTIAGVAGAKAAGSSLLMANRMKSAAEGMSGSGGGGGGGSSSSGSGSGSSSSSSGDPISIDIKNPVLDSARTGSALKSDQYHAFSDIIDNYAKYSKKTKLSNADLYQLKGSLNGVVGRFEWIIQDGSVTHRLFVPGGTLNGVAIKP